MQTACAAHQRGPRARVKNQQASQDFSQRMESEFGCNQVSRLKGVLSGASVLHGDLTLKREGKGRGAGEMVQHIKAP